MPIPIKLEFERAFNRLSPNEVKSNESLMEMVEKIRQDFNCISIPTPLKRWFHEFCHKLSIEEIMSNKPLIANLERLDRMFRAVEA